MHNIIATLISVPLRAAGHSKGRSFYDSHDARTQSRLAGTNGTRAWYVNYVPTHFVDDLLIAFITSQDGMHQDGEHNKVAV